MSEFASKSEEKRVTTMMQEHIRKLQKELAALQARVKELEDALEDICGDRCNAEYNPCSARQALSTTPDQALQRALMDGEPCSHKGCLHHITHPCECCGRIAGRTTPDQALQRALLDARIDEIEASFEDEYRRSIRIKYLRAKRAELGARRIRRVR